jgi:furin
MKSILIFVLITYVFARQDNNKLEIVIEFESQTLTDSYIQYIENTYGMKYIGNIFNNFHIVEKRGRSKRDVHNFEIDIEKLKSEKDVKWLQVQTILVRERRYALDNVVGLLEQFLNKRTVEKNKKLMPKCLQSKYTFNDPFWQYQWYLNDGCVEGVYLNITSAWDLGYTGKNVVVSIIDDGVEGTNSDLLENYDPNASIDLNDRDDNPQPRYEVKNENKHGTRCAGEISASANNNVCGVGIAYNSRIGGIRLLDGRINDRLEAEALSFNTNYIDIFSASWGPSDDGKTVEGPGRLTSLAFLKGINEGRDKKGVIYVWASGNGGRLYDNCNCDGYTASIYTITISSVTKQHFSPSYNEKCASILATTYSSDQNSNNIITSDIRNKCTKSHTGTSASAPIAAGIIALALEANSYLSWRDVQYLIVYSSDTSKLVSSNWAVNGIGRRFNHEFGFGLMNAGRMVELARSWVNVGEQLKCSVDILIDDMIEIGAGETKLISVQVTNRLSELNNSQRYCDKHVYHLEHVISSVTISSQSRGKLFISLVSPYGTQSDLVEFRTFDRSRLGFQNWPFMSVHYWGENPNGKWVLKIKNSHDRSAFISNWTLVFHGVENL